MTIENPENPDEGAMAQPAPFVNRFQIGLTSNGLVRIAYGELTAVGQPPYYRGAFMCALQDAEQLMTVLQNLVAEAKAQPKEK